MCRHKKQIIGSIHKHTHKNPLIAHSEGRHSTFSFILLPVARGSLFWNSYFVKNVKVWMKVSEKLLMKQHQKEDVDHTELPLDDS